MVSLRQTIATTTVVTLLSLLRSRSSDAFSRSVAPAAFRAHDRASATVLFDAAAVDAGAKESYDHVFVAGASRGLGRHTLTALRRRHPETRITALVRTEEAADELNALDGVTAVVGNALDYKSVETAMDECGCDAVITTLGRSPNDDGPRVDYAGNNHVIEAAGVLGVTRVVLVTSVGCGDSKDAIPESAYKVLEEALDCKTRAESVLTKYYTNTNWTIIRPGGLKSEPATGTAVLTTDNTVAGAVHREDVAELIVQSLTSPNTMRRTLSAVDLELLGAERKDKVAQFQL